MSTVYTNFTKHSTQYTLTDTDKFANQLS